MINLIIGAGEVGFHLAKVLYEQRDDVIIIDNDSEKLNQVAAKLDVGIIEGNGADFKVLSKVDFRKVRMVIAVTDSSEVNILCCFTAKQLGNPRTIARVRDQAFLSQGKVRFRDKLGVDVTVNPDMLCVYRMAELLEAPGSLLVENFARGKVTVLNLPIRPGCLLVGKALMAANLPKYMLIAAIQRGGEIFVPKGNDALQASDHIYVVTTREHIQEIERIFGTHQKISKRVVVYGGNKIGVLLAKALENKGAEVLLIEDNLKKCQQLVQKLPNTVIVHGDPTDTGFLREEDVDSYDVFFAVSENDHQNLVASLVAKDLGVKKVGMLTQRFASPFLEHINVDVSVSPKFLMANTIQRFIRRGEILADASIAEDKGEILELVVAQGNKLLNKPLMDLNLPDGILVGAIMHGEEVFIPRGDSVIHGGDHLVVFTTHDMVSKVEKLFCRE